MTVMVVVTKPPTVVATLAAEVVRRRSAIETPAAGVTGSEVWKFRRHPPILPAWPEVSSMTYRTQVPLGLVPLNTEIAVLV